ncbi:LysM peptidoglycan-binding domain-containing protein [Vagococcus xieshaowenii]|uniref:Peptidoglycan hydrolase n=1 Tax=Vagococcus xieshaowenii TaxID=2562451 RepID=A0AAJ5JMS9_9ENTE|nr:LysM peptidoglycan-binding domain-containing protein [Vagococcus xieshaowenii]QCA28964.1 LysM peptidoglycan-binding domain-containing protein [Vagococcus xieshaowenii]TFZ43144.1 LysM peptidoglycan-binding domain-containing protein [Vagococcus xieshaowenii]
MIKKHSGNKEKKYNSQSFLMKKSTSLLGTTLAMGSLGTLLDGSQLVNAEELDNEQSVKVEGKQEKDKLPSIETVKTPQVITAFASQADFVKQIGSLAQVVADENDLYASIMVAQAILESSWGNSGLASYPNHNLFGIKGSYNGQSVIMRTWEHINGKDVYVNASFRKYPSYRESLYDNAYVLRNTSFASGNYYYSGAWKSNSNSYRQATAWLTGRYATDPNYGSKLNNIIERYNLTAFDTPGSHPNVSDNGTVGNNGNSSLDNPLTTSKPSEEFSYYNVQAGDTLTKISKKHGVTVAQLRSWNKLSGDLIYVGQQLKVSKHSTNNQQEADHNASGQSTGTTQSAHIHKVVSGNTLYSLARQYGVSVAQIKSWNGLKNDAIYVGQSLKVGTQKVEGTTNNTQHKEQADNTSGNATTYKVAAGDTLYRIANKHGVSVAQIKSWNKLTTDTIYVGQSLKVSKKSSSASTHTTPNKNENNQSSTKTHQVAAGDTLSSISRKYGVSVVQIKSWNKMSGDMIFVGQRLTVKQPSQETTNDQTSTSNAPSNTSQSSNINMKRYTVKASDTLYSIAKNYNVSLANLKQWNALKSDVIYVGQTLKIADHAEEKTTVSSTSTQTSQADVSINGTYTVGKDDTLFSVANKHGMSVEQLKKLNNLRNHIIYVGQKLVITEKNQPASTTNTDEKKTYEVKKGDTLYSIAKKNKLTVKELKELNKLTKDAIYIGQTLTLK